ncbi:hypothetical protein V6N13_108212 [Hibiscus sabdariffa]
MQLLNNDRNVKETQAKQNEYAIRTHLGFWQQDISHVNAFSGCEQMLENSKEYEFPFHVGSETDVQFLWAFARHGRVGFGFGFI